MPPKEVRRSIQPAEKSRLGIVAIVAVLIGGIIAAILFFATDLFESESTDGNTLAPTIAVPTYPPTYAPSYSPTYSPTASPSFTPTLTPTVNPTATAYPTVLSQKLCADVEQYKAGRLLPYPTNIVIHQNLSARRWPRRFRNRCGDQLAHSRGQY